MTAPSSTCAALRHNLYQHAVAGCNHGDSVEDANEFGQWLTGLHLVANSREPIERPFTTVFQAIPVINVVVNPAWAAASRGAHRS